jgi:hypothetical protein
VDISPGIPAPAIDGDELDIAWRSRCGRGERHQRKRLANEFFRPAVERPGEGRVGEGNAAAGITADDEIALVVDQAAIDLLAFTQLPRRIGKSLKFGMQTDVLLGLAFEIGIQANTIGAAGAPEHESARGHAGHGNVWRESWLGERKRESDEHSEARQRTEKTT